MFSEDRRRWVIDRLLGRAQADERVVGAARTGSIARGAEDRWSDVDLFFGVHPAARTGEVLADWSSWLYTSLDAVHHFDLQVGPATYRAFLLADGLEVDLGFTPAGSFGPIGDGAFETVFGDPAERRQIEPDVDHLIGLGWHHAAHARVAIARDAPWQAEYWISALRNHTLTLACLRYGVSSHFGKGAGALPAEQLDALAAGFVARLTRDELTRALIAAVRAFVTELQHADSAAAERLQPVLRKITDMAS